MALGETLEPWESAEVGVDVVMHHLEAARSIAHHGGMFRSNAETKLQGELDLDVESTAGFLLTHKFLRRLKKTAKRFVFIWCSAVSGDPLVHRDETFVCVTAELLIPDSPPTAFTWRRLGLIEPPVEGHRLLTSHRVSCCTVRDH